jgi:hypothetical protein
MKPAISSRCINRHHVGVDGSGDGARLMMLLQIDEARIKSWLVISMNK